MQWWPVTCRHSWSNVLCYGHIRTHISCIPQPVSWGKSDLFDCTWVWLCRCYIYSPRAVKFICHILEKTLGYVTVWVSFSRSKNGLRAERWFRVTDNSWLFPTAKPSSTHFRWGLRDPRHVTAPSFIKNGWEEEWGQTCAQRHTQKSSRNETWIDIRLQGPSYFSSVFTFLGPSCVNAPDDELQRVRQGQLE